MTDEKELLATLRIAHCWLEHLIESLNVDPDTTTLNINVLGPEPARTLAKASLTESLDRIKAIICKIESKALV